MKHIRDKLFTKKKRNAIKRAKKLLQVKIEQIRVAKEAIKEHFERKLVKEVEYITATYKQHIGRLYEACRRSPELAEPTVKPVEIMGYLVVRTQNQLVIASKRLKRSINLPWEPLPDYGDMSLSQSGFFYFIALRILARRRWRW